jgi:hypothetical protein
VAQEKVLYQSDNVRVTSTRFIVSGQTFLVASISSACHAATKSSLRLAAVALVFGLLFGTTGLIGNNAVTSTIGLLLIGVALFLVATRETTHHVVLLTGAGRIQALSSANRHLVESVLLALDEALAARGTRREPGFAGGGPPGRRAVRASASDLERISEVVEIEAR